MRAKLLPDLAGDRILVAIVDTDAWCAAADGVLSRDELARAARFRMDSDRRQFAGARAALREIGARHLGCGARDVAFESTAHGKPCFAGPSDTVRFNVSHSGSLALIAVARDREVGVDIEQVRSDIDHLAIAARFFTREEHAELSALPGGSVARAFTTSWVRMEAYLKARGEGIGARMPQFHARPDVALWRLVDLSAGAAHAAALVAQAGAWSVDQLAVDRD